jgi:hypothetical protein
MTLLVSYMPESRIETDAEALLGEFAEATSMALTAPVPIDDIVEKYLKLGIEFDDLHRRLVRRTRSLPKGRISLVRSSFRSAGSWWTNSLTRTRTHRRRAGIGSRSRMKSGIGGCIAD